MKRKLCSVLLALCMVLTLLPVSALAEDAEQGVAQIGETKYETLQAAIDAVTTSTPTTIDVLADLTSDTLNTVASASADRQMAFTKADVNITLNLNNHTVTALGGEAIKINAANITLTITNGTIENHAEGNYSDGLYAYKESNNLNLTLTNVKIHSRTQGLAVQGLTSNSIVTINGGEIISNEGLGIYYPPKSGTLTVNDAKIEGKTGIVVKGSNLVVKGDSEIIGVGDKVVPDHYYTGATDGSSSLTETGDAIYVESGYNDRDITVKIESGKLTSTNSCAIQYYDHAKPVSVKREISISGGTFSDLSVIPYATEGATIKLANDTAISSYTRVNQKMTIDFNGHTVTSSDGGFDLYENADLTLTNGTLNTLKWGAWIQNGGKLTVEKDMTINASSTEANKGGITIQNTGSVLTVRGTVNAAGGAAVSGIGNETDGGVIINIEEGAVLNNTNPSGLGLYYPNTAELNISGGTITGATGVYVKSGKTTITGGSINGTGAKANYQYYGNGGIPTGDALVVDSCNYPGGNPTVEISGGSFTSTNANAVGSYVGNGVTTPATKFISGGTYSSDPTAYVADGYIARVNSDGTFTVVAKAGLKNGTYTTSPEGGLASGYSYYQDGNYYTVYRPAAPSTSTSTTTKNPDGSTTTTTTDKATGTVTETTKNTDGSTTTVETKKDGSVTETNKTANGSVGTVKSDANGNSEISASISAADVSTAEKKNEPVAAPVSVAPAAFSASAPVIKLSVPASAGEVSVIIPVTNAQQGTVAVKVNPDGTEEIIKTSVVTENGVVLGVEGNAQIKIVNNDKDFIDTVGHWAESDVDFVSARELFTGTAPQTFSPEADMTRGMVVTVLARLAGASTDGGANWYDKGCEWAVTNGVSDGSNPNGSISREQLAAMLYRYFGSPAVSGSLSFADASAVSEYAHDAMLWCVNNGIINGMDGLLNPQGQATRAQVSAMFARYIRLMATK